jgi:3-phenylpropionate/cinnamic acid dioxygenase small subunit
MTSITEFEAGIDRLQAAYICALDDKDMKGWLGLFSAEDSSSYTCNSAENVAADLPVALMLDDNRARLMDRVTFVDKVWAGTFQDYRTRHFIQRLRVQSKAPGRCSVLTNFQVMFTPEEAGDSRPLVCGVYEDEVVMEGGEPRFLHKRAITDTIVLPRYIVYPI